MEQVFEFMKDMPAFVEAGLAIIGGLKFFSRYFDKKNKYQWDDKVIAVLEFPFKMASKFFPKKK